MPSAEAAMKRRSERIEYAKQIVMRSDGEPFDKTVAIIAYNVKVREERAREYLHLLRNIGVFKLENHKIVVQKQE